MPIVFYSDCPYNSKHNKKNVVEIAQLVAEKESNGVKKSCARFRSSGAEPGGSWVNLTTDFYINFLFDRECKNLDRNFLVF